MKLYTEEQVMIAYNMGVDDGHNGAISLQINELSLTPIELPSDEEIEEEAESISKGYKALGLYNEDYNDGFTEGAKWVVEQIKQQDDTRR